MVFSDTSTKLGAIQNCEFYCQLGDGGISGNTVLLQQFTARINEAGSRVWHRLFAINGGWKYDDSNYSDLPQATQNLVSAQQGYALPSTALSVDRVEVMDVNGNRQIVNPIDLRTIDVGENTFFNTNGLPLYYRLLGGTIFLYPAPDAGLSVTLTAGLKVFFQRSSVAFAYTDTTKSFGFASEYHDIPPRQASIEWLKVFKPESDTLKALIQDDMNRMTELEEYETNKWHNVRPSLQAQKLNYR